MSRSLLLAGLLLLVGAPVFGGEKVPGDSCDAGGQAVSCEAETEAPGTAAEADLTADPFASRVDLKPPIGDCSVCLQSGMCCGSEFRCVSCFSTQEVVRPPGEMSVLPGSSCAGQGF
jgi:hypothetical protein